MDWDQYVRDKKEELERSRMEREALFKEAGVNPDHLPHVDLNSIEPDVRQQLQMQFGIDIEAVAQKPKKGASLWRQRTNAMMV